MSSVININSADYTEEAAVKNWAAEYAKRAMEEHKSSSEIDHPDGSVSYEKLDGGMKQMLSEMKNGADNTQDEVDAHTQDKVIHIANEERNKWNASCATVEGLVKECETDKANLSVHTADGDIHVTGEDKEFWNAKADKTYVDTMDDFKIIQDITLTEAASSIAFTTDINGKSLSDYDFKQIKAILYVKTDTDTDVTSPFVKYRFTNGIIYQMWNGVGNWHSSHYNVYAFDTTITRLEDRETEFRCTYNVSPMYNDVFDLQGLNDTERSCYVTEAFRKMKKISHIDISTDKTFGVGTRFIVFAKGVSI